MPVNRAVDKKAPEGNVNKRSAANGFLVFPLLFAQHAGNYLT